MSKKKNVKKTRAVKKRARVARRKTKTNIKKKSHLKKVRKKKVVKRVKPKQSKLRKKRRLVKKSEKTIHSFRYDEVYTREEFSIKLKASDFDWEISEFSDPFTVYSALYPYLQKILKRFRSLKNRPRFMIGVQYYDGIENNNYAFSPFTDFQPHPDQVESALREVLEELIDLTEQYDLPIIWLTHLVLRTYKLKKKKVSNHAKKSRPNKKR